MKRRSARVDVRKDDYMCVCVWVPIKERKNVVKRKIIKLIWEKKNFFLCSFFFFFHSKWRKIVEFPSNILAINHRRVYPTSCQKPGVTVIWVIDKTDRPCSLKFAWHGRKPHGEYNIQGSHVSRALQTFETKETRVTTHNCDKEILFPIYWFIF